MEDKMRSLAGKPGLILLIVCGMMFFAGACKSNKDGGSVQQLPPPANDSLVVVNDTLQSQNAASRMKIDGLLSDNVRLDSQLRARDAAIAKLNKEISHLKKRNKSLMAVINKDKKMLASLEREWSDKVKGLAEKLGLMQGERDRLAAERDDYRKQYSDLKSLASVLHASNIRLTALHLKHSGREKKTRRARKADVLRINFDIDENRIAEDGAKNLYFSIKDPEGHLLKGGESGVVTASGGDINYTLEKDVPLKQNEKVKDVTVDWKQENDYKKGIYRIAIFNGGYKIGGGEVTLN